MRGRRGDDPTPTSSPLSIDTRRRRVVGGALGAVAAAALTAARAPSARAAQPADEHVQAVVSGHRLATEAGVEVLGQGGTAADAAMAVAATLSVVEPWFSSVLGGGTWALYFDAATGAVTSLDGVGPTGSKATIADYGERATERGIHQANVPGAWDGWMVWLERFGLLSLGAVLAPAVRLAREGYEVYRGMATALASQAEFVEAFPASAALYAPDGTVLEEGDTVRQEAMAATFEALVAAFDGAGDDRAAAFRAARDHYYRGPLAEAIVAVSDEHGGYLTLEDFAGFAAELVEPVSIAYRDDVVVYQNPPNSQGMTQLLALNILKGMDLSRYGPDDPDAIHLQVEATKLAFADRYAHIGDPDRVEVPVERLLSDEHAAEQRARIDPARAMEWPLEAPLGRQLPARGSVPAHTTTFHLVDRDGNAAAVTTSLGSNFLVIGDTGIHINNRMRMLSLEEGNANQLTPGYKVRHTSCPYMALRGGRPYILGGNTGVDTQPQGQMQQVVSVVDFGLGAQETIDRPRFVSTAFPSTAVPWEVGNELEMEEGFPEEVLAELEARGHTLVIGEGRFGSANMLVVGANGRDAEVGAESRSATAAGEVIRPGLNSPT